LNLPVKYKLRGGWSKYVLRNTIRELPDQIRWRRDKQGFLIPDKMWLKKDFEGMIKQVFEKSILDEMGIIDSNSFMQYYRRFQNGDKLIWYSDISRTLFAELWARQNWLDRSLVNIA
jgi:asparagine synthase (glutamine-hydrolysing)